MFINGLCLTIMEIHPNFRKAGDPAILHARASYPARARQGPQSLKAISPRQTRANEMGRQRIHPED